MCDEGAKAIVEDVVANWEFDIISKYLSFKRLRDEHKTPITKDSLRYRDLVEYLKSITQPLLTYWTDFYSVVVSKDKNMNYTRNRLNVLVKYLLYTLGQLPKPCDRDCAGAEVMLSNHRLRNQRIDVVRAGNQWGKQKPLSDNCIDIAIDDEYNESNELI
jgi:hypothetical protein